MSTNPEAGDPSFNAGRDIRGAFATGAGSEARHIEAKNYFEINLRQETPRSRSRPIYYSLANLPDFYQVREAEIAELRAKLLGLGTTVGITSAGRAIGLKGMGGIGKTVLATALTLDPVVRSALPGGIVWLTFGRDASVLAKASELASALVDAQPTFSNVSEARGQLSLYTANDQLLIVLDDIWEPEAVEPFSRLGAKCRLLITTRDARVLERAQATVHRLDLLDQAAARAFLAEAAATNVASLPAEVDEIIRQSGRLPLALAAVGKLIQKGAYTWTDALVALREGAAEDLDTSWLPDLEQRNLAVVLKLSVDALSDETRDCLLACAACREDIDIPETPLLLLWSAHVALERRRKLIAQELVDRSLIQRDEARRYRIHDLYMDYLRHAATPLVDRHHHLLNCYRAVCPNGWASGPDDGYFFQHLPWHLKAVEAEQELLNLLFDPRWLRRKLDAAGIASLIQDCSYLPEKAELGYVANAQEALPIYYNIPEPFQLADVLRGSADTYIGLLENLSGATVFKVGSTNVPRSFGLIGLGGTGKTVIAAALVNNPYVRKAFPDGVCWLTIGSQTSALSMVSNLLEALTGLPTGLATLAEGRDQLGLYTAQKRLLVVLDDVLDPETVAAFTDLGCGCRLLITTRNAQTLERAQASTYPVSRLDSISASALLAKAAGIPEGALPPEADQIIQQCGGLPLALAIVGSTARIHSWSYVLATLEAKLLDEFSTPWRSASNLAAVMELSITALSDDLRTCFQACAIFPKDVIIPEAVLIRLWSGLGAPERRCTEIAEELADRALIYRDSPRGYRIHELYLDYLRTTDTSLIERHQYLLDRYRAVCPDGWESGPDDGYFFQHLPRHLNAAGAEEELHDLLCNPRWRRRRLDVSDHRGRPLQMIAYAG